MSSSVSTVDAAPAACGAEEPPAQDGWRNGGLPALRAELDRIDDAIHDMLMQRAEIVEYVARSGKPAAFRPGREASIIRRLLGRHRGALPPVALVRIWRELLAGTTSMQGGFSLAVCDGEPGAAFTQLAREHFGALTPMRACANPREVLADVSRGSASVGVLPYPSDTDNWWVALPRYAPRLYVIGRLPFWQARPAGFPSAQALVVASTMPDASEADRSFVGLECDRDAVRAELPDAMAAAGLRPENLVLAHRDGSSVVDVLAEVQGSLSEDDDRLRQVGLIRYQPIVLGSYAVPIAGGVP